MSQITIIAGAQWGDEGKGKWVDILSDRVELVARYQGGNNAGHTLYINGEKVVLHQIPSGIFRPAMNCALSAGVVFNPESFVNEINMVKKIVEVTPDRLWISEKAHVITPWHIYLDILKEQNTSQPIGTTKRGIGPTYAAKSMRTGIRVAQYVDSSECKDWVDRMCSSDEQFKKFYDENQSAWGKFEEAREHVKPFVCDAEARARKTLKDGKNMLMEGAQGILLDIDHGTYPFVTSSSTASGGAFTSIGFSPKLIGNVYGVAKAYVTRVGEGPFPTELFDDDGKIMASVGKEFGSTTGRSRRCGWFDCVAMRYSADVNGLDGVILNKLDVLSGFDEIKFATMYEHPVLGKITDFPSDYKVLAKCKPVYKSVKGWKCELPKSGKISDLPKEARVYIDALEKECGIKVAMVGTGPNRENSLFL
jgi:adenylosuccinate synthase